MERVELVLPSSEKTKPLVIDGKRFRSVYDFKLTEDDLKQAYLELGETEEVRIASLETLKKELSKDGDVIYNTSDDFLLRYLRFNKFQVEKAYNMLRRLGKLRTDHPEIFDLPSNLEMLLSKNFLTYMPYRDEEGSIVVWADFRNWKIEEIPPMDVLKIENAFGDLYTMNPSVQINSLIQVWDLRGWSSAHLTAFLRPSTLRLVLNILQDTYPWRIKRIILLHSNKTIRAIYNTFRHLFKKKIADRIVLLGSNESDLLEYLNPVLYPKEYGGMIEGHESSMKDFILENIPYMKYQRSFNLVR